MISSTRKAKLIWHCRRGMLELDLLLRQFVERNLATLTAAQLAAFEELLSCSDPELYDWLMGYAEPTDRKLAEIVTLIKLQD